MSPAEFHFLRPWWLAGIVLLILALLLAARGRARSRGWEAQCDPALLPYVLQAGATGGRHWIRLLVGVAGILALIAAAGPTWERIPTPVYTDESAVVIALDLSRSMDATDISPSRLVRARYEIADLLARRKEGQTGLVVYAADAWTVSPLTTDTANILQQLPVLTTDLVPAQGSRADLAYEKAVALMKQAGVLRGSVLLVTDGIDARTEERLANMIDRHGQRLLVFGIGTSEGAPIPTPGGGFLKDAQGSIIVARYDPAPLDRLAQRAGGRRFDLAPDESDVEAIEEALAPHRLEDPVAQAEADFQADQWLDRGPWLLLLVLPLAALMFRRGYLALFLLICLPLPREAAAFGWDDLWKRPDQQAMAALEEGRPAEAAERFEDPAWAAVAHYRAGNYEKSLEALEGRDGIEDLYNKGNAYARLGRYVEALEAYEKVLAQQPDHEDARHNRDVVRDQLKSQSDSQGGGTGDPQSNEDQKDGEKNQQGQGSESGQNDQSGQSGEEQQQEGADQGTGDESRAGGGEDQAAPSQAESGEQPPQDAQGAEGDADRAKRESEVPHSEGAGKDAGRQSDSDTPAESESHDEDAQATEQWLRRIPDDPGGLLRRKFLYQYQNSRTARSEEEQQW